MTELNIDLMNLLIERAQDQTPGTYADIAERVKLHAHTQLNWALGAVSDECRKRGLPVLSALAFAKKTGIPSPGFFEQVAYKAYGGTDDHESMKRFWKRYLINVYVAWQDIPQYSESQMRVPTVCGEESVRAKPTSPGRVSIDEASLFAALEKSCSPEAVEAFRQIYDHAVHSGADFQWGTGAFPSVTARYVIERHRASVWSCYARAVYPTFDVNFKSIASRGISSERIHRLLSTLSTIPGVDQRYSGVESADFKKRPSLNIEEYLTKPGAMETIIQALDDLILP
jgi:hypothetical protein